MVQTGSPGDAAAHDLDVVTEAMDDGMWLFDDGLSLDKECLQLAVRGE